MTMRWMHPPDRLRDREDVDFDPVAEGGRYHLSREVSLALWARVRNDASASASVQAALRQRFHQLAAIVAARGGRLGPDAGRRTRVGVELDGARDEGDEAWPKLGIDTWTLGVLAATGAAGRTTRVSIAARRAADRDAERDAEPPPARGRRDLRRSAESTGRNPVSTLAGRVAAERASLRALASPDRATRIAEVARLARAGELAAALRRDLPGLADAVAAALHDRAILAPHPVDIWRDQARGLGAHLAVAGHALGQRGARLLRRTPLRSLGERALDAADAWSDGAARSWTARATGWADGVARRAMAYQEREAERGAERALAQLSTSGGVALPIALRARMEALFGHSFAHVRLHSDAAAAHATEAAGARAVTIGSHIYFNRGQLDPGSEAGARLLLHELTHVVQHDEGRLAAPTRGGLELSSPSDAAEHEARAMESRAVQPAAARPAAQPTPRPPLRDDAPTTGQRASRNVFGDAASWVGDRVDDVENWAEDKIEGLVARVAPGLVTLIHEGPGGLIKDALQPAISGWVGSLTGGINIVQVASQLKGSFSAAFGVLDGAKAGDPRCCETLVHGIEAIRSVAHAFMDNPVMDAIRSILTKVSDIVGTITKLVIGPAFDVLKTIVGGAWTAIEGVASTIQGWFNTVKNIAGRVFDWVAKKLGFSSGTGEGGLLDWLKQKAAEIWDKIKQTLQPVIGPLKVVAGVLLMLTGLPEIYAIIKYGPQIVEAVQWLWANRNNPEAVKQNPGGIGGTVLPKILGVGQSFVATVKSGVAWLVDKATAFATGALQLFGAITGIPLLSMAQGFVKGLADGVLGIREWASGAFTSATTWLEGLYHRVADFIKPYAEVLCSVAVAVTNPAMIPVILAGWAWRWLPDCIKPPLIDLLLDAVIAILEKSPSLPMLGPLWPLLKAGVVGFLHAVRARDPQTKIKVSNKLAKIISGASPMFLVGFVKGLLRGVWDGIKMPFEAIWMVAKGIEKAGDFFAALGADANTKAQRPAVANAAAAPARPSRPSQPMPAVPGEIRADQATSVVRAIAGQLNADRPARPPQPRPGAPTPAAGTGTDTYRALGAEARRMGGALAGPGHTVATGFWPAVQQLFSSGKGTSIDGLMAKLHKVWDAAKAAVGRIGAKIANMICDFLIKDDAEEDLGDTIGYLVGMIAFQALLDYLSAGTWTGAMGVLSAIAKFLNWPMEFLGEAMKALKSLGGFMLDGLKQLGGMISDAGAGALREVTGAFREIATKLGEFADELMAKFGNDVGKADSAAAHTAEADAAKAAEKDAAGAAEKDAASAGKPEREPPTAAERELEKAEELIEAVTLGRAIVRAEDVGHVPGPAIATSLEALKARYRWIKTFVAETKGRGYELYLIASKEDLGPAGQNGLEAPGTPGARSNPLTGARHKLSDAEWSALTDQERAYIGDYAEKFPGTKYSDQDVLDAYRRGEVPGKGGGFVDPNRPVTASETKLPFNERQPVPEGGWSPQNVLDELKGTGSGGRDKSFGQFSKALGLDDAEVLAEIEKLGDLTKLTEDQIRHHLKDIYKTRLFDELGVAAREPGFDVTESYNKFKQLTEQLNSSDKGNMMEEWYQHVHGVGSMPHVQVKPGTVPGITEERFIDLLETREGEGTIRELKSHDGKISPSDGDFWSQFDDYMTMYDRSLATKEGVVKVTDVRYVFTSQGGAIENLSTFERMFESAERRGVPLQIEVFDKLGALRTFSDYESLAAALK